MKRFDYNKELVEALEKDRFLRHLFNKINKEVEIKTGKGDNIKGVLKTIEYVRGKINLEVISGDDVYFLNWRYIVYLKTKQGEINDAVYWGNRKEGKEE